MSVYSQYIPKANDGGGLGNGTEFLIQQTYQQDASEFVGKQCGSRYANAVSFSAALTRITAQCGIGPGQYLVPPARRVVTQMGPLDIRS